MVAIEGNGDATEAEVPATELQWGDGDSQRCEGETEGGMEGKKGERERTTTTADFSVVLLSPG